MNEMSQKVRDLVYYKRMTMQELAHKIDMRQPNLSRKLRMNNFSENDLRRISEALEVELEMNFIMEDGRKI